MSWFPWFHGRACLALGSNKDEYLSYTVIQELVLFLLICASFYSSTIKKSLGYKLLVSEKVSVFVPSVLE